MQISVHSVGKRMPNWVEAGVADYTKRLPAHWRFQFKEIAQSPTSDPSTEMAAEAKSLLSGIHCKHHVVALDPRGTCWTTEQLSSQLSRWQGLGKSLAFLIGGPHGLHSSCIERADQLMSLSALTFPHTLVRIMLVEQLYRAHTILINHPYHRA